MVEYGSTRPLTTQATQSMATLTLTQNTSLSSIPNNNTSDYLDTLNAEAPDSEYRKQF